MKRFVSLASAMMAGAVMARYHHHHSHKNETQMKEQGSNTHYHKDPIP
jgi:hypothetical protein